MKEISNTIIGCIKFLNTIYPDFNIKIIDDDMTRKFPNSYNPNGYWGVTISICDYETFLKNQMAEDILSYGSKVAESYVYSFLNTTNLMELLQNEVRKYRLDDILDENKL